MATTGESTFGELPAGSVETMDQFLVPGPVGPAGPAGPAGPSGSSSGDVGGPDVAVDSNFAAFDTTTGKLIKDSGKNASSFDVAGAAAAVTPATLGLVIGTNVLAQRTFGSAANNNTGDFATSTQGAKADAAVVANTAITGATKTKVTYDSKGLVTSGADATTADIAASTDKNYVTDAQLVVMSNTSGTNTGNQTIANTSDTTSHTATLSAFGGSLQFVEGANISLTTTGTSADGIITIASSGGGNPTSIVGITGTKAEFDTAVTDGNILYVGDITQYTDEMAQDATGAMVDTSLVYTDGTPLLQRAALTGAITASVGSNATSLGSFTTSQLNTALSDNDIATGGGTATGTNTGDNAANTTYASDYRAANFVAGTNYVAPNVAITGATKTKITYDAKGLVTAGADATTADIAASTNKNYVTDAQLTVIGNTSGTNSGNQTSIVGITGTLAQFNTAVTDAELARTDAANTFTGVQTFSTPIATGSVATMTATVGGGVPTPPNNTTTFLRGDGSFATPAVGLKLPTYTVGASGADYTTIQGALDAATTGGLIYVTDGTYVIASGLKFKANYQYIIGNGEKCIIQFNGATVATLLSPNATNFKQCGIHGVSIQQTNATVQGTALDLSDMALMSVDVEIKDAGVAVKMNDANNNTFYNRVNIRAFGCARGIELNGTTPSNHNYFSGRIANKSGGDYGVYIVKGQGNSFKDLSIEPVATTGNTGIYLTSANAYANTFENVWIEGNANGVTIDSTVTYNSFIGGTVTANTTNRTDSGKNTAWFNTQVGSVALTVLQPFIATDTGNASSTVSTIQNNTSFAHTGGKLVGIELLNGSDTSKVLELKNGGTGNTLSIMQGASEVASVTAGGKITTLSTIEVGHASDTTLSRSSAGVLAVEGVVIPTTSSTNTITNKRQQPRIVSATSYTTDTGTSLDFSTCDIFIVTAQAGALKFNNPSGSPQHGEKIIIRVKDNGTARALTYDTQYRAVGVTLPTTTVISKTVYLGGIWNTTDTKLDIIAVAQEA